MQINAKFAEKSSHFNFKLPIKVQCVQKLVSCHSMKIFLSAQEKRSDTVRKDRWCYCSQINKLSLSYKSIPRFCEALFVPYCKYNVLRKKKNRKGVVSMMLLVPLPSSLLFLNFQPISTLSNIDLKGFQNNYLGMQDQLGKRPSFRFM